MEGPPPHERTPEELRAFHPEPGVLERLFLLKERVDPDGLLDGAGTIPTRSAHVGCAAKILLDVQSIYHYFLRF
jgi:hypothetical protein